MIRKRNLYLADQRMKGKRRVRNMKRMMLLISLCVFIAAPVGGVAATETDLSKEIERLKQRIEELERNIGQTPAAPPVKESGEPAGPPPTRVEEITELITEKVGKFSIEGGIVGFYQGTSEPTIEGEKFQNPNGMGYVADLALTFSPHPAGELFVRVHAGEGDGGDRFLEPAGALFADLNTMNDDHPENDRFSLLEAFYTHTFLDESLFFSIGKTEPLVFMDENAFANDEYRQFVGKAFVNNPVLDSEDEYAPLLALGASPSENWSFTFIFQSSSRPLLEEEDQKSPWDRVFSKPFLAAQAAFSPSPGGLEGNYRLYAWTQTYDHPRVEREGVEEGWGIGLSLDQMISEKVGLFTRVGYQNREVYEVPWFWSLGADVRGILPGREQDNLGIGVAGLKGNNRLENDRTELQLETYYRWVISPHMAVGPHFQYVRNPLGNRDNDDVFAGMFRAEISF
jgi:hypothetical protein